MPPLTLRVLTVACLLATVPAAAQEAPQAGAPQSETTAPSQRTLYKTATYQSMSSFNDFAFAATVSRVGAAGGGLLAGLSLVTEPIVYYVHETAWTSAREASGQTEMEVLPTKTVSYAMVNSGRVFLSGLLVTGSPLFALGFTAFNAVGDAATSAGNDTLWAYFAPTDPSAPAEPPVAPAPTMTAAH